MRCTTSKKPIREASRRFKESRIDSIIEEIKSTLGDIVGDYEDRYGNDTEIYIPGTEYGDEVGTFETKANYECFNFLRKLDKLQSLKPDVTKYDRAMLLNFNAITTEEEAKNILGLIQDLEANYCIDPDGAEDYYWDELERAAREACPDYDWNKLSDFIEYLDEEDIYEVQRCNYDGVKIEIDKDIIEDFEENYKD